MKHLANSTKIFIETLERQAVKRVKNKNTGKVDEIILDDTLYKVFQLYKQGKIKFQDHAIEIAASVSGATSVKFLDESDTKKIGIKNLALAKLNENEYFCPVAISMLGVDGLADVTDTTLQAAEYGPIDTLNAVANAQVDIIVNTTEYLVRELVTSKFIGLNGQGSQDAPKGTIFLDNTTIMKPAQRNEINLKSAVAMPNNCAVKFILHGTRTTPVGK